MRLDVFLSHDLNIVKSAMLHCNQRNNPKGLIRAKARTFATKNHAFEAVFHSFEYQTDEMLGMLDCVQQRRGERIIERQPARNAPG